MALTSALVASMNLLALRSPRARHLALVWGRPLLLLLLGALILFYNYGAGAFNRWDESLYGQFARNALTYHSYLLPLDEAGRYSREGYSKPPLAFLLVALSFKLFQPSIGSLRLPFTLATLLLALVSYAWGNDISRRFKLGPWLGVLWGLFILLSEASMIWGRYAMIEDVFVLFMVLALWLHTRAFTRGLSWSLLAGLALALAFLTKQLAVGLAMAPMFVLELLHLREQGLRRGLARTLLWATPPLAVALGWALAAYAREGQRFAAMLWDFALVQRFEGYQGTTHFNTFNRVSRQLDTATYPFVWLLGAVGLFLYAEYVWRRRARGGLAQLSPFLFFLSAALVLENATKSLLPWYVLSFLPGLALGAAWLVSEAQRVLRLSFAARRHRLPAYRVMVAALGAMVLFVAIVTAAIDTVSQVNLTLALLAGGLLSWRWLRASSARLRHLAGALLAGSIALLLLLHLRHDEYRISPGAMEVLMGEVGRAGMQRPVLSSAVNRSAPEHYEPVTLFGTHARAGNAPWLGGPQQADADGFVDLVMLPEEAYARLPGHFVRAPGATLFTGDLRENPLPDAVVAEMLAAGPLTFEAEWMDSSRAMSLASDGLASGGKARRYKPWLSEGNKDHEISRGTTLALPAGEYVAETFVRWHCGPHKGAVVGVVKAGGRQRKLSCKRPDHLDTYRPVSVSFSLAGPAQIALSVTFLRGRGQLWHDKTSIWRADVYRAAQAPAPAE